jgi:hypothetical protein
MRRCVLRGMWPSSLIRVEASYKKFIDAKEGKQQYSQKMGNLGEWLLLWSLTSLKWLRD